QARRALLEEAAGISGLHSRRHEAELRLRAAETNLERLDDVIAALDTQLESLKRQARQAARYRNVAGDIRRAEATLLHIRWKAASEALRDAETAVTALTVRVAEAGLQQGEAARLQAVRAAEMPGLREGEAKAAAALQHLTIQRTQLDEESQRIARRKRDVEARVAQMQADIAREEQMIAENSDIIGHLDREEVQLRGESGRRAEREAELKTTLDGATEALAQSEQELASLSSQLASTRAQASAAEQALREGSARRDRMEKQAAEVKREQDELTARIARDSGVAAAQAALDDLNTQLQRAVEASETAEQVNEAARQAEQAARAPLAEARSARDQLETEARTLAKMLETSGSDLFAPVVESMTVAKGYERALGAALGDDLDAPVDSGASRRWTQTSVNDDPALPAGVDALGAHVSAPTELQRRLAQIGVVDAVDASSLAAALKPGQRLVTKEGAVWRWDGYCADADAKSAAALRLEQKNRLAELDSQIVEARGAFADCEEALNAARQKATNAAAAEKASRDSLAALRRRVDDAAGQLRVAERDVSDLMTRRAALEEAAKRIASSLDETRLQVQDAQAQQAALPPIDGLEHDEKALRDETGRRRATFSSARADFDTLARENAMRDERLAAIEREKKQWKDRAENADRHLLTLRERQSKARADLEKIEAAPDDIAVRRREITAKIETAEAKRKAAADALAVGETAQRESDKAANEALTLLSDAKQAAARAEERQEAAKERRDEIAARIREDLECQPHEAFAETGLKPDADLPEREAIERKIERLRGERERLGAVNLRAEQEQEEIAERRDTLVMERDELIEAIAKLRSGIQSLNKEGRERLLVAFDQVNDQFQKLFTHLFGGGTAELQLVESDDPLEAGLEILARPPGKKPQTMTLLSGGEQALTAMALIFAVFLTNPAPICVLDEVDAPLDDHNVERFCNLMDQMAAQTDTRFVIITHNPITMARMDRLFGVTMAERGVSQLVSVDLQTAESFREAV
ncbi:MAG: chromosome segregation protein SMC, partial [Pseudomonadota bacterium]